MLRSLFTWCLALGAFFCSAPAGAADTIDLSWDSCTIDASTRNRDFACDTDGASFHLVGSLVLDTPFADCVITEGELIVMSDAPVLPAWWEVGPYSQNCRRETLTADASVLPGCRGTIATGGSPFSSIGDLTIGNPDHLRLTIRWESSEGLDLAAGPRYQAFHAVFGTAYTVGASPVTGSSCGGCAIRVCIELRSVTLQSLSDTARLTTAGTRAFVTWQNANSPGCPGPVPTRNATWGSLKSIYR